MEAVDIYLMEIDKIDKEIDMNWNVEQMLDEFEIDEDWATANGYRNFQVDVAVCGYDYLN